jgi:hypothetical protein
VSRKKKKRFQRPNIPKGIRTKKIRAKTSSKSGFEPDYDYIRKDLKRIGILAGSFVTLLIVLSFFLR